MVCKYPYLETNKSNFELYILNKRDFLIKIKR